MEKNTIGALVALIFFATGMLFWPQQWQGALPMATFVAHAMMAWRFAAGRFGVVWWWGGPVALLALLTMPLAEAVLWTLSFASMLLALSRVLPAADYRLASLSSLFRLQLRCVLPAAFLVATLAGVMPAASWPVLLQHFTLAWLTLVLVLPLAYASFPSDVMRRDTLWLMLATMLAGGVVWALQRQACLTSCLLAFLPLLYLAALRGGLTGVAGVGVALLFTLSVDGV